MALSRAGSGRPAELSGDERAAGPQTSKRDEKSRKARRAILSATMRCLAKYGYADTSTTRITKEAGVSRGAMTHHFPSKEELMVEATKWILRAAVDLPVRSARNADKSKSAGDEAEWVSREIYNLWDQVINTEQMRALIELLVASRVDEALNKQIKGELIRANETMNRAALRYFASVDGDDERFARIWTIARVFFRGLITHYPFVRDESELHELILEFIDMIAPLLKRRDPADSKGAC